jgi:hypothetical protein
MAAFEVIALDTATPQLRAPGAADTYTFPRAVEMPLGTANGVLYLNGSKVVTTGSALTFNGSNVLAINVPSGVANTQITLTNNGAGASGFQFGQSAQQQQFFIYDSGAAKDRYIISSTGEHAWYGASEQMRLTSTGLGIGTTNPTEKLEILGNILAVRTGGSKLRLADQNNEVSVESLPVGAGSQMLFKIENNERMRLDSSGNLGLGVTPSAWVSYKALQVASTGGALSSSSSSDFEITTNAYYNGGWLSQGAGVASSRYRLNAGTHAWFTAPSGTAGNAISFTQALTLDANRNLLLNGTAAPASGVGTLAIFNGTAPTGSVTNGIVLYAEDVSSSSELKVRDEAGNVTTLSPHNFELIPEGPSEDMAWSYYSERDGKRINVDMLKAIRLLEKLSGEQLVYEA